MNKMEIIEDVLKCFVGSCRSYRNYSLSWFCIEKVWNRGMGCRDLLRVNPYKNEICVVKGFARKADYKRIDGLKDILEAKLGEKFSIVDVEVEIRNQLKIVFS